MDTIKAAIYARKSTEDERSAEDGKSTARQIENGRAFALKKGWLVLEEHVFVDENISGAEFNARPGLGRLLASLKPRPSFQALVVMEASRIGRDTIRTLAAIQTIGDAGVSIWSYADGKEISVAGDTDEVQSFMGAWSASQERRKASSRTREALVRKARQGHLTGSVPYGYKAERVGDHSELRIDPDQAAVVRKVFELAAQGYGNKRLVVMLKAEGAVPASWGKEQVRAMLTRDVYRGVSVYGKSRVVTKGGSAARREHTAPDDWTVTPVEHLRIVSDDLWTAVHQRKAQTRAAYMRNEAGRLQGKPEAGLVARHLLSGFLRCPQCGGAMGVNKKNPKSLKYYCQGRSRGSCTNGKGLDVAAIDAAVRAKLADLMSPDHWAELHAALEAQVTAQDEALAKQVTGTDQRAALEAEVARLEAEVARLVNAIASGAASADITTGINARRAQIEEIRAKLNARPFTVDWDSLRKNVEHFYAIMRVEIKKSKAYRAFVRDLAKTMPFDYTPGPFDLGPVDVVLLRQALRKVGVSRIIPSHDADGGGPFEAKQT